MPYSLVSRNRQSFGGTEAVRGRAVTVIVSEVVAAGLYRRCRSESDITKFVRTLEDTPGKSCVLERDPFWLDRWTRSRVSMKNAEPRDDAVRKTVHQGMIAPLGSTSRS